MRLYILCVAATLVAAVAPQVALNPKLILPPNPTSANYFTAAEYAWSGAFVWGVRTLNVVRKLTAKTAFNDFLDSRATFAEPQSIAVLYSKIVTRLSQNGLIMLHKEVLESNKTVKVPTVTGNPELIELESEDLFTRGLEKFAECVTNINDAVTLSEKYLQNSVNEIESQIDIHEIDQKLQLGYSKLRDFDEYTQVALQKWSATLLAYGTSSSEAVTFFEQSHKSRENERRVIYQQIFITKV